MFSKKPQGPISSTSALARHLGLSRWTISRVLNGHAEVKPETSRRVREAMVHLGFVPSPAGRALRGSRTGMVGICFQALGSPIVARKIATLQRMLRASGYRALCELTDGAPELELEVIRHFVAMKVDGLVLVGGITEANATGITQLLVQHQTPVVLVDPLQPFPLPIVELDRAEGMCLALDHLRGLGHRRFALFGIDESVVYGRNRWQGIRRFAQEHGLSLAGDFVTIAEAGPPALDFDYGRRLARRFLELPSGARPTAAIALNDQVAIGVMARLQRVGLTVPGELAIVGFDNLDVSAHVTPLLTTIDQHVDAIMAKAVELLVSCAAGGVGAREAHFSVAPGLVVRESTAIAPGAPSPFSPPQP